MRVMFMGNHTVGVRALISLCAESDVVAVVAHPPDCEDGVRYESVYEFAIENGLRAERLVPTDPGLSSLLDETMPDLIWLTDYRYILPKPIIDRAPLGVVNLHPSLLPRFRGRAPLNWAILHGETELGLTAHFVSAKADAGDIIAQERFELTPDEDVGDALSKLYPLYEQISRSVIGQFKDGCVARTPQPDGSHCVYPPRQPDDGYIDWNRDASSVHNLIRAVAKPYPGAFGMIDGVKIVIWKSEVTDGRTNAGVGDIVETADDGSFSVACACGAIRVLSYCVEPGDASWKPRMGKRFTDAGQDYHNLVEDLETS